MNYFAYIKLYRELVKRKIPYIIIPHGELTREALRKKYIKKKIAYILFFNRFVRHAEALQMLSEREMNSTRFRVRKFVSTNGIVLPSRCKTEFSRMGLRFVYVGRLDVYHKGLDLMLAAIDKAQNMLRAKHCTFCLYGPDRFGRAQQVRDMIESYGIQDIVQLLPPVFGEEKENALLDGDIFIQTSRFEGMPMGILEALSYGLPCMVTEGTAIGDTIRQNEAGWTVPTSVDGIVNGFEEILVSTVSIINRSLNAIKTAQGYAWDNIVRTCIEQYEKILAQKKNKC